MITPPSDSILSLRQLVHGTNQFRRPKKEDTFFTIGGRGYYENPASDLLSYFMTPHEHGLHRVFLAAFLDCMKLGASADAMVASLKSVHREQSTSKRNRIDLTIHGKDWMLIIENKIRHWVANPLEDYIAHAGVVGGKKQKFFAILSPAGDSPDPETWRPVSYRMFVDAVRDRLDRMRSDAASSKWHVFAEEFVLHLDQEICQNHMNKEEIEFIEANHAPIEELKALATRYQVFIAQQLRSKLEEAGIPGLDLEWKSWGFWVDGENRKNWDYGLISPAHSGVPVFKIKIRCAYSESVADDVAAIHFPNFIRSGSEDGRHTFTHEFTRRDDAINELCRIMKILSGPLDQRVVVEKANEANC